MCKAIKYAPANTHPIYGSKKYGRGKVHSAGAMVMNKLGKAHNHTCQRKEIKAHHRDKATTSKNKKKPKAKGRRAPNSTLGLLHCLIVFYENHLMR